MNAMLNSTTDMLLSKLFRLKELITEGTEKQRKGKVGVIDIKEVT